MGRLLAAFLITCSLTAQLSAQASKEQAPKEQESAVQAAAAPNTKNTVPAGCVPGIFLDHGREYDG